MAIVEQRALAPLDLPGRRLIAALSGFAVMTATAFMLRRAALEASSIIPLACAGLAGLSVGALALTLEDAALPKLTRGVLAGSGLLVLGAFADFETRLRLFSFASVAFGAALVLWLARTSQKRPHVSLRLAAIYAATLAVLCAHATYLVLVSRDLDDRRLHDLSRHLDHDRPIGRGGKLAAASCRLPPSRSRRTMPGDPRWSRASLLAATEPASRAIYSFALLALYAAPSLSRWRSWRAASPAARRLPRPNPRGRGRPLRSASPPCSSPFRPRSRSRRMGCRISAGWRSLSAPFDLADRLARLLALRQGHDARVAPMTRRAALALALSLFAMFAFRRWYAFAAAGIALMLAVEVASNRARPARAVPVEGSLRRRRARRSHAARALEPGDRRLAAEPGRA